MRWWLLAANRHPPKCVAWQPTMPKRWAFATLLSMGVLHSTRAQWPGVGLSSTLGLGYGESIDIYVPKRQSRVNLARPDNAFYRQTVFLSGVFASGQEKSDDATLFVPIALAQELCDYTPSDVSAVEIRLKADVNTDKVQRDIQQLLGDDFTVKNRYEQQADFYRILRSKNG